MRKITFEVLTWDRTPDNHSSWLPTLLMETERETYETNPKAQDPYALPHKLWVLTENRRVERTQLPWDAEKIGGAVTEFFMDLFGGGYGEEVKERMRTTLEKSKTDGGATSLVDAVLEWWETAQHDADVDDDGEEYNRYDEPPEFVALALQMKKESDEL